MSSIRTLEGFYKGFFEGFYHFTQALAVLGLQVLQNRSPNLQE